MKKAKIILSLVLAAALCLTLFAACAKTEDAVKPDSSVSEPSGTGTAKTDTPANKPGDNDEPDEEPDEIANIVVSYLDVAGNETSEWDRLEAYCNSITEPEIGVHVDFVIGQMGDYGTNIPLMIASNEQLDVLNISPMGGTRFPLLLANNSLLDVREELETYAADALALVGENTASLYRRGEALYGIPTNRLNTSNQYIILRKDILEATGTLDLAENVKSFSDLEELYAKVKDYCDENNLYIIGGQKSCVNVNAIWPGDDFASAYQLDAVGDSINLIYVDETTNKVMNRYQNEDLIHNMLERGNDWNAKGYVYPDTILGDDHVDNLFKQGVIFSYWNQTEIGVETARYLSSGYHVVAPMACQGKIKTDNLANFGVVVPVTTENPVAACKFINLLYTDARISTIFAWGIEGEDYVMVDGEADYPDPKSNYHGQDYMIGNQMLVPAWKGQGADFRARALEANQKAVPSAFLGLSVDVSDLNTTVSALSAVCDEYRPALLSGEYKPENLDAFNAKLNSVGMQDYMDAIQTQVDAWLASR